MVFIRIRLVFFGTIKINSVNQLGENPSVDAFFGKSDTTHAEYTNHAKGSFIWMSNVMSISSHVWGVCKFLFLLFERISQMVAFLAFMETRIQMHWLLFYVWKLNHEDKSFYYFQSLLAFILASFSLHISLCWWCDAVIKVYSFVLKTLTEDLVSRLSVSHIALLSTLLSKKQFANNLCPYL